MINLHFFNENWCISYIKCNLNYFHSIVVKLCTTEHQSRQEPETLSVADFLKEKLLDLCEMSQILFLVYLNILTQSIVIIDSIFNFGNFFTNYAITFDLTEIERKNIYFIRIQFCCASIAAIKNVKIARFFFKFLLVKS